MGRFHFDTNIMVVVLGNTANMGAMPDGSMKDFAKCIFKNTHEFCIGFLTFHVNSFADMLLKDVKYIKM